MQICIVPAGDGGVTDKSWKLILEDWKVLLDVSLIPTLDSSSIQLDSCLIELTLIWGRKSAHPNSVCKC